MRGELFGQTRFKKKRRHSLTSGIGNLFFTHLLWFRRRFVLCPELGRPYRLPGFLYRPMGRPGLSGRRLYRRCARRRRVLVAGRADRLCYRVFCFTLPPVSGPSERHRFGILFPARRPGSFGLAWCSRRGQPASAAIRQSAPDAKRESVSKVIWGQACSIALLVSD